MKELMKPKMWIDYVTLPTYEVGEPNKNPLFLEKKSLSGKFRKNISSSIYRYYL